MLRSLVRPALACAALAGLSLAISAAQAFEFSNDCSPHGVRLHGGHQHVGHAHAPEDGFRGTSYVPGPGYYGYGTHHFHNPHYYQGYGGCRTCSNGDCQYRFYGQPDLFYNYTVPPTCGGMGAELYLSPRPVPAHVGHTYITYQPLMPHEFMYQHHRTYHRYYNSGQGLTRTHVHYGVSHLPNFWK